MPYLNHGSRARFAKLLVLATVNLLLVPASAISQDSGPPHKRHLTQREIRTLLRGPQGLEAVASAEGDFVLEEQPEIWGENNLGTLVSSSSLIVVGEVRSLSSRLSADGDEIFTDYVLRPSAVLKGEAKADVTFCVIGGKVVFPNKTSAEVKTIEWRELKVGKKYVVFLQPYDKSHLPVGGLEGIMEALPMSATSSNSKVQSLASHDNHAHGQSKHVEGRTLDDLLGQVRSLVSQ